MKVRLFFPLLVILFASCSSVSNTMVHTEGVAKDVVDEQQSQNPNTTANPNIGIPPLKALK
jgi:hypothetical protein